MNDSNLKLVLTILQYASISISGTLGILGLLYNYKNKETGRLTKSGRIAIIVLAFSLGLGLISKTVELELKRKADESQATKARIASEQALKVAINVERVVNAVNTVNIELDLSASLDLPLFDDFRKQINSSLGISENDREFSDDDFRKILSTNQWKQLAHEFLMVDVVILIYPKGSKVPVCFSNKEEKAPLEFNIPIEAKSIEYPQQETTFKISFDGKVEPSHTERSHVMSLIDFKGATIIGYIFLPIKSGIPQIDSVEDNLLQKQINFEKQFPSSAWHFSSLEFIFDGSRTIYINDINLKRDKCTGQPYFIAKTED